MCFFGTGLHFTRPTLCFNEIQVSAKNKVGLTAGLAPRSPCVHGQTSGVFHGLTEIAGPDIDGRVKKRGWTLQDWTMADRTLTDGYL